MLETKTRIDGNRISKCCLHIFYLQWTYCRRVTKRSSHYTIHWHKSLVQGRLRFFNMLLQELELNFFSQPWTMTNPTQDSHWHVNFKMMCTLLDQELLHNCLSLNWHFEVFGGFLRRCQRRRLAPRCSRSTPSLRFLYGACLTADCSLLSIRMHLDTQYIFFCILWILRNPREYDFVGSLLLSCRQAPTPTTRFLNK